MTSRFHRALNARQVLEVPMDDVRFISFNAQIRSIGTQNLNGCTAVGLFSPAGAIMTHIPPNPDPRLGIANLRRLMGQFILLYHQHLAEFPSDVTSIVVGGTYRGTMALEDHLTEIRSILSREGISPGFRSYSVS
ncbi:uncharacterized protein N7479_003373 [Penicillium vulpinum]|uniref:Uncharacterized protein n=1 Tax=Penicillium vulpinum TaxID=29845 RepID=A0A1V6QX17_9EURO|nr:uncharacterized protein N7479_003373 [Penicillium vulpinum]KAJ5963497.1 hypothetical protein N7479_003373 [Penicillium vulpinum]OQD93546.1 hypothetical protein PENVUL_c180G00016 [Penicillium vulpinum]